MSWAGVSVRAGQIYVAQLSPAEGDGLLGSALGTGERFAMNANIKDPARLSDLADRLNQYFSHHQIHDIVLVEVRKRADWKYSDAHTHVMAVAAVMIAAHQLSVTIDTVNTEKIAKVVGTKADELKLTDFAKFGYAVRPTYWTAGMAAAFAAAAYGLAQDGEIDGTAEI